MSAVSTDSIRDRLFARAIVVDDGTTCAVLVGLDLGGASNQIVDDATAIATSFPTFEPLMTALGARISADI